MYYDAEIDNTYLLTYFTLLIFEIGKVRLIGNAISGSLASSDSFVSVGLFARSGSFASSGSLARSGSLGI